MSDAVLGPFLQADPHELRLGLTLSGGGFRATLFHLGVVRCLYEAGLLASVRRIGAVSGGSILAAHLVLNWDRYTGDDLAFDAAAQEIIAFTGSDVRGRVVRRWILAWLTVITRLFKRRYWTFTNLLQRFYARLYNNATLRDLSPRGGVDRPQVFFYCTSLSTGSVCSFGRSGFMWYEQDGVQDVERSIVAPETPVAFAVAASSAFPPLFPPIAISAEVLSCDIKEFPNPQYLTDGGIYDNLGIDRLMWYHKQANDMDCFLISDAEGNFDWDLGTTYTFITSRNVRASDLLMKRVSTLKYETLGPYRSSLVVIDIDLEVQKPGDPAVLSPQIQRGLRNIRTDLDSFSPLEAMCLIQHGFTVARERLGAAGLLPGAAPVFSWQPFPPGLISQPPKASEIRKSRERKLRLWALRDWASWASLLVIVLGVASFAVPAYNRQQELTEEAAAAGELRHELREVNQKLYFQTRHRPVEPGTSAGHNSLTAGTICCVVRLRTGGPERYLLGAYSFAPAGFELGDLILQPSRVDGGILPQDAVARLSRVVPLDPQGVNVAVGAIAGVAPGVQVKRSISGLGPLQGTAESVSLGQRVFVVGRSAGVTDAIVSGISITARIEHPGAQITFKGLFALQPERGEKKLISAGDSGAPVVTSDGRLAGMIIADSRTTSFAVPIQAVFDALDIELDTSRH